MPFLERHPASDCRPLRCIEARLERDPLRVTYVLEGDIDRLRIPPQRPARVVEGLWRQTCCELFIADEDGPGYREFNLSPSGEWAAYEFERYREGRPLAGAPAPQIAVRRSAGRLELAAIIALRHHGKRRVGLAAVIEDESGVLSYWALRHPPGKPDFHHREAFALQLDETRD